MNLQVLAKIAILSLCVLVALFAVVTTVSISDQNDIIAINTEAIDSLVEREHIHDEESKVVRYGDLICLDGLIQTEYDPTPFSVVICADVSLFENTYSEDIPNISDNNIYLIR